MTAPEPFTDAELDFLAEVAAELRPKVQAELHQMAQPDTIRATIEVDTAPLIAALNQAAAAMGGALSDPDTKRLLDAVCRSKTWRLGPIVVRWAPIGETWDWWRHGESITFEVPGHEVTIATRRWSA